ncbi:MAG: NOL1/NOP2/sun family putative RNA methylase [Eubacteriales bacterium]|nr:NOL1/NOP2/sun family putative RNA methylase [Eubacteriales bacterium]
MLPEGFKYKMKSLLGESYDEFIKSFENQHHKAIRRNPLKIDKDSFERSIDYLGEQVPWCDDSYYIADDRRPGKDLFYHCGLFYIQEPSASLPVELLNPRPGEFVLDLCAAPGGKTTQIGAKMGNTGLVVANDVNYKRLLSLKRNIQLFGLSNTAVTNEQPLSLKRRFSGFFDKVLVDAPCSGEGMFRRDDRIKNKYDAYDAHKFTDLQKAILSAAGEMLKPGGSMVYSTCTFSLEENEEIIDWFLSRNHEFKTIPADNLDRFINHVSFGFNGFDDAVRIWPHRHKGEGHFAVRLEKDSSGCADVQKDVENSSQPVPKAAEEAVFDFFKEIGLANEGWLENLHYERDKALLFDATFLKDYNYIYKGLEVGYFKNNRFFPSQALAMVANLAVNKKIDISSQDINASKYLKGESIYLEGSNGWTLVTIDGYPVGWGKLLDGLLKNHYLKEWRLM